MKITPEDMQAVRDVLTRFPSSGSIGRYDEQRDTALALILVRIYDRGFEKGVEHGLNVGCENESIAHIHECPYTFAHTRHWCGYAGCRES